MSELKITVDDATVRKALENVSAPRLRKIVLQSSAQEVIVASKEHFDAREQEPEKTDGFPKFGQSYGKRNFWSGTNGNSVAEAIQKPVYDPDAGSVLIDINSPALAHKADSNPPPIVPKGGRTYLAIPANARAASFVGMPRDFDVGGGMTFGFSLTPDGRWLPALIARENHLRTVQRGKHAGESSTTGKATRGLGDAQFWLVRSVQTQYDPRAMPDQNSLSDRANACAVAVLERYANPPPETQTP